MSDTQPKGKPPVVLVDVMNLVFRCHYAFRGLTCDSKPTGVLYGGLRTLLDLREKVSCRMVFCWDHGIPVPGASRPQNWRVSFLPSYKASRKPSADYPLVLQQLPEFGRVLELLGYTNLGIPGLEADDLIGILASELSCGGESVLIFSTDRDLYQLLGPGVEILVPKRSQGAFQRLTVSEVEAKWGVPVTRWAEYLALGGDSSDNIKPRRGMGPKTAVRLIQSGLDLEGGLLTQPKTLRKQYDLESIWEDISHSYRAARLPRSWDDERIVKIVGKPPQIFVDPFWENPKQRARAERAFETFCADYELVSLLSRRHAFFHNEYKTCTLPTSPQLPPKPPQKQAKSRLRSILV